MRHRRNKLRLNRNRSWRRATLISLSRNLLIHQRVRTTKIKAKAAVPLTEKLITLGKKNDLASRREAFSILQDHSLVRLLYTEIAPRFSNRNGGYCRIIPLAFRRGDGASLVILELTEKSKEEIKPKKKEEKEEKPEIEKEQIQLKPKEAKEKAEKPKESEPKKEKPKEEVSKIPAKPKPTKKPPLTKKAKRNFLGDLKKLFKKKKDAL